LIEDFLIQFCKNLKPSDFVMKSESVGDKKIGKREYLNDLNTTKMLRNLNEYFSIKVNVPRIRRGDCQEIETLICEEALELARYIRNERENWNPRIATLT